MHTRERRVSAPAKVSHAASGMAFFRRRVNVLDSPAAFAGSGMGSCMPRRLAHCKQQSYIVIVL